MAFENRRGIDIADAQPVQIGNQFAALAEADAAPELQPVGSYRNPHFSPPGPRGSGPIAGTAPPIEPPLCLPRRPVAQSHRGRYGACQTKYSAAATRPRGTAEN